MSDFDELMDDLKRARDEINLRIHLASMDVKDEWKAIDARWQDFSARANLEESGQNIGAAFGGLAREFRDAFKRIKVAIKD